MNQFKRRRKRRGRGGGGGGGEVERKTKALIGEKSNHNIFLSVTDFDNLPKGLKSLFS